VLVAQGIAAADARSVIRVSIGVDSTSDEVDGFGIALRDCVDRLRAGALL
jgi:cysteine sulfinate desulfinase/cysteine desulfurase-like protein